LTGRQSRYIDREGRGLKMEKEKSRRENLTAGGENWARSWSGGKCKGAKRSMVQVDFQTRNGEDASEAGRKKNWGGGEKELYGPGRGKADETRKTKETMGFDSSRGAKPAAGGGLGEQAGTNVDAREVRGLGKGGDNWGVTNADERRKERRYHSEEGQLFL